MRSVAIFGKAQGGVPPSSVVTERWGSNDLPARLPEGWEFDAWDRWFDIHSEAHINTHRPDAWQWYCRNGTQGSRTFLSPHGVRPIYLHEAHLDIAGSVAYPRVAIQQAFAWGGQPEEFFTSSFDWMMALAIREGFKRIELYGVDMWAAKHERSEQRNGAHYWIGRARGLGIDVMTPECSSLCKTERLYGYVTPTSGRNFSSMSCERFMAQWKAAEQIREQAAV